MFRPATCSLHAFANTQMLLLSSPRFADIMQRKKERKNGFGKYIHSLTLTLQTRKKIRICFATSPFSSFSFFFFLFLCKKPGPHLLPLCHTQCVLLMMVTHHQSYPTPSLSLFHPSHSSSSSCVLSLLCPASPNHNESDHLVSTPAASPLTHKNFVHNTTAQCIPSNLDSMCLRKAVSSKSWFATARIQFKQSSQSIQVSRTLQPAREKKENTSICITPFFISLHGLLDHRGAGQQDSSRSQPRHRRAFGHSQSRLHATPLFSSKNCTARRPLR